MGQLNIKKTVEINASAEQIWNILGEGFVDISTWATGVRSSINNPSTKIKFKNAPAGGRICQVDGAGEIHEKILHYNSTKREITWSAESSKIPGFVSNIKNAWSIEQVSDNKARASANLTADLGGIMGFLMGGILKGKFTKTINGIMKELAVYAETGKVSASKQKEIS